MVVGGRWQVNKEQLYPKLGTFVTASILKSRWGNFQMFYWMHFSFLSFKSIRLSAALCSETFHRSWMEQVFLWYFFMSRIPTVNIFVLNYRMVQIYRNVRRAIRKVSQTHLPFFFLNIAFSMLKKIFEMHHKNWYMKHEKYSQKLRAWPLLSLQNMKLYYRCKQPALNLLCNTYHNYKIAINISNYNWCLVRENSKKKNLI